MTKATHTISVKRKDRLKPALYEEGLSLCDLEPTSSEYLFEENMNESLKFGKYQIKKQSSRTLPRTGFKRRPDHEAGSSFSSRN